MIMTELDVPFFDWESYSEAHREEAKIMVNWHCYQDICGYDHRFFRATLHDAFKAKFGGEPDYFYHQAWVLYQHFLQKQPIDSRPSDGFTSSRLEQKILQFSNDLDVFRTAFPEKYGLVADLISNLIINAAIVQATIDELNSDNNLLFPYEPILLALQLTKVNLAHTILLDSPPTADRQPIHQSSTTASERLTKYRERQSQT